MTATMTDQEILQAAAARLREWCDAATPGPWVTTETPFLDPGLDVVGGPLRAVVALRVRPGTARLIAALGPDAAPVLADAMESEAHALGAMVRLRDYQERRAEMNPHDGHTFVVPQANPAMLAYAHQVIRAS